MFKGKLIAAYSCGTYDTITVASLLMVIYSRIIYLDKGCSSMLVIVPHEIRDKGDFKLDLSYIS
jgi:hypothetical protein